MTPSPATREDIAVTQMHIAFRANPALSQDPTPTERELFLAKQAVEKHRNRQERVRVEWDRYEAEAASDPYFGGQGPRW